MRITTHYFSHSPIEGKNNILELQLKSTSANIDDCGRVHDSDYRSVYEVDQRSRVMSTNPRTVAERPANPINARSRFLEDQAAFYAQKREDAEKKRREDLKAKLDARFTKDPVPKSTPAARRGKQKNVSTKDRAVLSFKEEANTLPNTTSNNISKAFSNPNLNDETRESTGPRQVRHPVSAQNFPLIAPLPAKKYSSTINLVSDVKPQMPQTSAKHLTTEQKNEARRIKDGEKARNNHRERLLKEAEDGDYTISEQEMKKRLDAFMKKREVCMFSILSMCDVLT